MNATGYSQGSGAASGTVSKIDADHSRLKRQYLSYLENKNSEIDEQKDARRYYHGAQYTAEQVKAFKRRKQPVVTYNRIGRKINGIIGLLERQRQDPRGFPRTPKHEEGAEIATAVLRYVLDSEEWPSISAVAGLHGAVDGIGGLELVLEPEKEGDFNVSMEEIDPSSFFYDPRSLKADFSDARYMGVGKWADLDMAMEMFPEHADKLKASLETGSELTSNPDWEDKWFTGTEGDRKLRIVDHWYIRDGRWHYCVYTGSDILDEGVSPFMWEDGETFCKFLVFSANVDHDGDRYGFVRNMRSSQDEINMRRSKGLHILNSRRIIIEQGAVNTDNGGLERLRTEAARPDGIIVVNPTQNPPVFDDAAKAQELNGHLGFLEDAKMEIENYGFNPALIGTGVDKMSGRAMQIQQQAGITELGPYILDFKAWKLRVYRAIWATVQRYWKGERWIRVTDDEGMAQFFAVNQLAIDPNTGVPTLANALGSLDVDIIIDEGPDTINMQQDAYDTLTVMAQNGQNIPPQALLELSPLHASVKKKIMGMLEQAQQQQMQMQAPVMQLEMQAKQAETEETQSRTALNMAKAQEAMTPEVMQPGSPEMPMDMQVTESMAKVRETEASTALKLAQAHKTEVEAALKPQEMRLQEIERQEARQERFAMKHVDQQDRAEDRKLASRQKDK